MCPQEGRNKIAVFDARILTGQWAYVCEDHAQSERIQVGTGYGQRLIVT